MVQDEITQPQKPALHHRHCEPGKDRVGRDVGDAGRNPGGEEVPKPGVVDRSEPPACNLKFQFGFGGPSCDQDAADPSMSGMIDVRKHPLEGAA